MSYPTYQPVEPFSHLDGYGQPAGQPVYSSPGSYSGPFPAPAAYDGGHGDLGTPGIEMHPTRPYQPDHRQSEQSTYSNHSTYSNASTLFPSHDQSQSSTHPSYNVSGGPDVSAAATLETQPFLHDPLNKIDQTYMFNHIPYEDHTGRQLRHLLIGSSTRWFITAGLCAAYIMSTRIWAQKGAMSEAQKRMYNAISTAISIALGLNIASAFKDLALNMRWPILSARKRNLSQVDLILHADSLTKLAKLAFISRGPWVILTCILWLLINILAQAGIAMLNLTYGFEANTQDVILNPGNTTISNMHHFWPQGNNTDPEIQDEEYIAHLYGGLAYNYGLNETKYMPKAGDMYKNINAMLWFDLDNNRMQFIFSESGPDGSTVYTDRTLNISYICDANQVTAGGNGSSNEIEVANIGKVYVSHAVPETISYFTNANNRCGDNQRCSIVEAFEASSDDPWYYSCNVTLDQTQNDPQNLAFISDQMAYIATSSIAQVGYSDSTGQEAQIYPQNSLWGYPLGGSKDAMGLTIATWALGSIAGATLFNPSSFYMGVQPSQGQYLKLGHPYFFYLIIGLICGCHLVFAVIVAILANRVMVGPDSHLKMSLLLRPIADSLEGVSAGKENSAYRAAKKQTQVRYEKARNGRWILNMG